MSYEPLNDICKLFSDINQQQGKTFLKKKVNFIDYTYDGNYY